MMQRSLGKGVKIVLIGAGSRSFGAGQIADVLQAPELRGRGVTLALVDEDPGALDLMARLARRIAAHVGSDVAIETGADRRAALPGAAYVILAVARRRMALWEQDFRVPLAHGFRHCLGENGGPGALFHALRSLELVVPICRDVEACCPEALLLNFTNPEARVLHAILTLTRVRAVGLCHGVFTAVEWLARYLECPADQLHVVSAGMNHFYCVLQAVDRRTGCDRLAEAVAQAAGDDRAPPLFRKLAEVFGIFTFPSDDHIGEYLAYGAEFSGVKWHYGQECRPVPLAEKPPEDRLASYASGRRPLDADLLRPSGELAVPIIADIERDRRTFRPAVNVLNRAGYVEDLPRDMVVEVPAVVDRAGVHPQFVGPLPAPFAALVRTQAAIVALTTEAYRTRSKRLLLQALLLDPNVTSITAAERLLDDMLELQKEYLPVLAPPP
jgi:alpha-galactosidase